MKRRKKTLLGELARRQTRMDAQDTQTFARGEATTTQSSETRTKERGESPSPNGPGSEGTETRERGESTR